MKNEKCQNKSRDFLNCECASCRELCNSWDELSKIPRIYPEVPAALDQAILAQAGQVRRKAQHWFMIRHVARYVALAAVVCLGFLVPFLYDMENVNPDSSLTTPRTAAQWDLQPTATALQELRLDIENNYNATQNVVNGGELSLDTVLDSLNYYEVIL